jgi:FkbM family methyltransferase
MLMEFRSVVQVIADPKKWNLRIGLDVVRTLDNWPSFLAHHFGLLRSNAPTYRLRNGKKYKFRIQRGADADVAFGVIHSIWTEHCYTPVGFEIGPADTVVDVGSHVGVFAIFAAEKASAGRVIAVEPISGNYELLEQNILLNSSRNVVPLRAAISGKSGPVRIFLAEQNIEHSIHANLIHKTTGQEMIVQGLSLADLMETQKINRIDFLKINCEGAEYDILLNCTDDTLRKIRRISLQYHNIDSQLNKDRLISFLRSKGFIIRAGSVPYSVIYAERS